MKVNHFCQEKVCKFFFVFVLFLSLLCRIPIFAQNQEIATEEASKNYTLNGYLKFMQTVSFQDISQAWTMDNLIHNRLNFRWYINPSLTFTSEIRNRIFYGETVKSFPNYAQIVAKDYGLVNINFTVFEGQSVFMNSTIDRLYWDVVLGNWEVRIGRQRINWGQTFIWNPNDIFNAYSFFDFDYEERPGTDAVLIRKYLGVISSAEMAFAPQTTWEESTFAAKLLLNIKGYDFQVITGKFSTDYTLGFGWTGAIKGMGFKGEASYFYPMNGEGEGQFMGTLGLDYTYKNLMIQYEMLYNSNPVLLTPETNFFVPLTARTLSYVPFSAFLTINYQITPLTHASLGGIWNPEDASYFLSPSVGISLGNNTGLYFVAQIFGSGNENSMFSSMAGNVLFGRVKWSF